jgi:hypothetical protein
MPAQIWIRRIVGATARLMTGDKLLDLAEVLAGRAFDPCVLGGDSRDAGKLAHGTVVQLARVERSLELGQVTERTRDAQPFLRSTRRVAESALHVVLCRCHSQRPPDLNLLRGPQTARFFPVEARAFLSDRTQLAIDQLPPDRFLRRCTRFTHHHRPRLPRDISTASRRARALGARESRGISSTLENDRSAQTIAFRTKSRRDTTRDARAHRGSCQVLSRRRSGFFLHAAHVGRAATSEAASRALHGPRVVALLFETDLNANRANVASSRKCTAAEPRYRARRRARSRRREPSPWQAALRRRRECRFLNDRHSAKASSRDADMGCRGPGRGVHASRASCRLRVRPPMPEQLLRRRPNLTVAIGVEPAQDGSTTISLSPVADGTGEVPAFHDGDPYSVTLVDMTDATLLDASATAVYQHMDDCASGCTVGSVEL